MKRYKLTKAISKYDSFLNERNEAEIAEAPAEIANADSSREAIIADIDGIINSLETLAGQVTEMLEELQSENINEKSSLVVQWAKLKTGLGAKQKKVNQMKLKSSDMATAAAQLQGRENADKKAYLKDKKANLDQQIKSIQALLNDRADELGTLAAKGINKLRLQGEIEVVKSQIGSLDPTEAGDMKKRLKDLIDQEKKEADAVKDLAAKAESDAQDEKGDDKVQALKDELAKIRDAKKQDMEGADKNDPKVKLKGLQYDLKIADFQAQIAVEDGDSSSDPGEYTAKAQEIEAKIKKLTAEIEAGSNEEPAASNTEEPAASNTEQTPTTNNTGVVGQSDGADDETKKQREVKNAKDGQLDRVQQMIDAEEEKLVDPKDKAKIKEYEDGIKQLEDKEKKSKQDQNNLDMLKVALKNLQDKVAKSGSSPKLDKLKKLKADIMAKESWQLDGTELGRIFEMEITKLEAEYTLNESRYYNNSIKDAFSRLI